MHFLDRGLDGGLLVHPLAAGFRLAPQRLAAAAAAHGLEPRHLEKLQRGHEFVGVDLRRAFELGDVTLGQLAQALGEGAQLLALQGAVARHAVGRARRIERPRPVEVTRPARDRGTADAGLRRDLAVGEGGVFDQPAHLRDARVAMRAARALAVRAVVPRQVGHGIRGAPGRAIRPHAEADN